MRRGYDWGEKGRLTIGGSHGQAADGAVEEDEGEALGLQLVDGGLEDAVAGGLEVAARDDLEGVANVDDEGAGLVGDVVPLLVAAPDLQARDGHGEELRGEAKVGVAVHAQALGGLLRLLLDRPEQRVPEVALARRAAVRLHVVPQVVVGQLEHAREERQQPPVDRLGQVVAELLDLVHERVQARRHAVLDVLPVGLVPVELLDSVGWSSVALCTRQR